MTTLDEVLRITQQRDGRRERSASRRRREPPVAPGCDGRRTRPARWPIGAVAAVGSIRDGRSHGRERVVGSAVEKFSLSLDRQAFTEIMMVPRGSGIHALTSRRDITNRWTPGLQEKVKPPGRLVFGSA